MAIQKYEVNQCMIGGILPKARKGETAKPMTRLLFAWDAPQVYGLHDSLYNG